MCIIVYIYIYIYTLSQAGCLLRGVAQDLRQRDHAEEVQPEDPDLDMYQHYYV